MKLNLFKLFWLRFVFLILITNSACSKTNFTTEQNIEWRNIENNISVTEVSIADWLIYLVVTSFDTNKNPLLLYYKMDVIKEKLPELNLEYWNTYVFNAFLSPDGNVFKTFYDHTTNKKYKVAVNKIAWDSIVNLKLMEMPVVGISYEQAQEFIKYKNIVVNKSNQNSKKITHKIKCYLPSPANFDSLYTSQDSVSKKNRPMFNYKNASLENFRKFDKENPIIRRMHQSPLYIWSYFPDKYGLFNLKGNVSELTSVKGIAKGGSFFHYAEEAGLNSTQRYSKPEAWLGFRVWYTVYSYPNE